MSHHKVDVKRVIAWGPSPGITAGPIIAALRAAGFGAMIGSRREPANNFEVECYPPQMDEVAAIIATFDPGATRLTVGR